MKCLRFKPVPTTHIRQARMDSKGRTRTRTVDLVIIIAMLIVAGLVITIKSEKGEEAPTQTELFNEGAHLYDDTVWPVPRTDGDRGAN